MTYKYEGKVTCTICGERPAMARKLCRPCYAKEWKKGVIKTHMSISPEEAFMLRIDKTETCWVWRGTKNGYGYGTFLLPGSDKSLRAHRFSYELHNGPIPEGMVIMHTCDNPPCVNPDHLKIGTKLDNNRDAISKRRNQFGERHGRAKLTDAQVEEIKASTNITQRKLAEVYGVDASQISRIISGTQRKKSVGVQK